jgi:polysaccharide export outer membrane protein
MSSKQKRHLLAWVSPVLLLLVFGCAANISDTAGVSTTQTPPRPGEPLHIALGNLTTTADGVQIVVAGSQPFSYNLSNHDNPLHLTFDIPHARVDQPETRAVGQGGVQTVRLSQAPGAEAMARLEVHLDDTAAYSVAKEEGRLIVRVRTSQPPGAPSQQRLAASEAPASGTSKPATATPPGSATPSEYRVGPSDELSITVYDEPDLSRKVRVSERGSLAFPLIGTVQVQGLSTTQIAQLLVESLSPRFLLYPQVFVEVTEFASKKAFIVGAVDQPTTLVLRGETTLLEVLSNTQGLSHSSAITVFRRTATGQVQGDAEGSMMQAIRVDLDGLLRQGDMTHNLVLQPNDVIYIPKPDTVFVFGEVNKTGPVPLPDGGMTLVEAINHAEGFGEFAAPRLTRVLRIVDGKERVIQVDMAAVIRGDLKKNLVLKANDIVIVPETVF